MVMVNKMFMLTTAESCSLASRSVTKAIVGFSSIVLLEYNTVDPSKGFSAPILKQIIIETREIVVLHSMQRSLKRSDFTRYANLMRF